MKKLFTYAKWAELNACLTEIKVKSASINFIIPFKGKPETMKCKEGEKERKETWRKQDPWAFTCGVARYFYLQQILLEKKGREIKQYLPRLQSWQPANHTLTQNRSNVEAYMFRN